MANTPSCCIKVNIDGSAIGALQISGGGGGGGGVFHNCRDFVHRCFSLPLCLGFSFDVKLQAFMHAVGMAWSKGWTRMWLESDSTYVNHMFKFAFVLFLRIWLRLGPIVCIVLTQWIFVCLIFIGKVMLVLICLLGKP